MFQGKTKLAFHLITEEKVSSVLHLDSSIGSSKEDAQCTVHDSGGSRNWEREVPQRRNCWATPTFNRNYLSRANSFESCIARSCRGPARAAHEL